MARGLQAATYGGADVTDTVRQYLAMHGSLRWPARSYDKYLGDPFLNQYKSFVAVFAGGHVTVCEHEQGCGVIATPAASTARTDPPLAVAEFILSASLGSHDVSQPLMEVWRAKGSIDIANLSPEVFGLKGFVEDDAVLLVTYMDRRDNYVPWRRTMYWRTGERVLVARATSAPYYGSSC